MVILNYDAFPCFRRTALASKLHEALEDVEIHTFKDGDELNLGSPIAEEFPPAIANSRILVVIFSENYATSKWCLQELVEIVKATQEMEGKEILPKQNLYTKQLSAHRTTEADGTIQLLKKALASIPDWRGWELLLKNLKGGEEFCREIVKRVSIMLKLKQGSVSECLVGMDYQVKNMLKLFDMECLDVQVIGIQGISGIGKTTLASLGYNKIHRSFEHCSFILAIQEFLMDTGRRGPLELQKKILADTGYGYKKVRDTSDAMATIQDKFSGRRVLIVLDDVTDVDEIRKVIGDFASFGGGSTIIITTRNKQIIQTEGLMSKSYEIEEMKGEDALQLFSWHAFGKPSPPSQFSLLSNNVVSDLTGGLPLTLEAFGSQKFQEKLRISYEDLGDETKEIFLDIACFFVHEEIADAMYMWESCNLFPELGLDELITMSLVKVKRNKFWMHDQLRDLGRGIVRQEGLKEECSRLWMSQDALEMLKRGKEGQISIKTISLNDSKISYVYSGAFTITPDEFGGLDKLGFLELHDEFQLDGTWKPLFPNLIWLSWHFRRLDFEGTILSMKNLVGLDLSGSNITEDWEGWREIKDLSNLKVVDLSYCHRLTTTPDLSNCANLERLILRNCSKLVKIDDSVASLKALKHLDLRECYFLQGLRKVLSRLVHLEEIIMDQGVSYLPNSIGDWKSLSKLELGCKSSESINLESPHFKKGLFSRLTNLPESLGSLKALEELSLSGVGISTLPESTGGLVKLKSLRLTNCCELRSLPDSIGRLVNLECLLLGGCFKLISIPSSLTSLVKLQWLDLSHCLALKSLPDSMGIMGLLKEIDVSGCGIRKLPRFIVMQKQLEVIKAEGSGLVGVPIEVEMLSSLRVLKLTSTKICGLPSLTKLTCLEELSLESCDCIEQLPMLPASLTSLRVVSESLQSIADLSNLIKLKSLLLVSAKKEDRAACTRFQCSVHNKPRAELPWFNIDWISGLPELTDLCLTISKITTIPTKFCALSQLKELTLRCSYLQCSLPLPYNLETLYLSHFKGSTSLYLSLLKNLKTLTLSNCEDLTEIPGLGESESLQTLHISNCPSLKRLDNVSKLKRLKFMVLSSCNELTEIRGLEALESLARLTIDWCNSLEGLAVSKVKNVRNTELLDVDTAGLEESKSAIRFNSFDELEMLDVFISRCNMLRDLQSLKDLVFLSSLTIKDCSSLERLFDLSVSTNLTKMTVQKCEKLKEIPGLEEMESVKHLVVKDCSYLERLSNLSKLRTLEQLHIEKCKKLREINGLESGSLKSLHISYCNSLEWLGINPLDMNRLEYVCIEYCDNLREIRNSCGNTQLIKNNSSVDHGQMSFTTLPSDLKMKAMEVNGSGISSGGRDSNSSDSSGGKDGLAQYSIGLDDHPPQSSSDEESGRTARGLTGSSSNSTFATCSSDLVASSSSSIFSDEWDPSQEEEDLAIHEELHSFLFTEGGIPLESCPIPRTDSKAAKTVLKRFFAGGIEMLGGSADLVPVVAAAKALSRVEDQGNGGDFWDNFSSKVHLASSSYKLILKSIEAADSAHANYAELKKSAVEIRNNYVAVKSQMDHVRATKGKALSEIDALQARLVELEKTVVQAGQQLQDASSERKVLVAVMEEQVGVMRTKQEEIQARDADRAASQARLISLKTEWESWAAHLD